MSLARDFSVALRQSRSVTAPAGIQEVDAICLAARDSLFVDGVGISVFKGDARVPLGASDEATRVAESLQFTVGNGPCLDVANYHTPIHASLGTLRRRWPALADMWVSQTPFRSVLCYPLDVDGLDGAAINLLMRSAEATSELSVTDVAIILGLVTHELLRAVSKLQPRDSPDQPGPPAFHERQHTWVAVGMVTAHLELLPADALARMRSHAWATSTTVDELATRLIDHPHQIDDLIA